MAQAACLGFEPAPLITSEDSDFNLAAKAVINVAAQVRRDEHAHLAGVIIQRLAESLG